MILDQYNNYGGPEYDRGLFRHTTRGMNPEHDIDLMTIHFTPFEHYQWYYDVESGYRQSFGSLDLGLFTIHQEITKDIDIGSKFTVPLNMRRSFDQRQERSMAILGLEYQVYGQHRIGFNQTFSQHKPDLDGTIYYKAGTRRIGFIQLNATFTDMANQLIYSLAERREIDERRKRRTYNTHPYYFSFTAATPVFYHFRAEAMAGLLTQSEADVGPLFYPHNIHRDRLNAHYSGLLIEYARSRFTTGVTWQHTFTRFSRVSLSVEADEFVDLGNSQREKIIGAFAAFRLGNLHLQNWFSGTRFRDQQHDIKVREEDYYPFDFEEYRYFHKSRLIWRPDERGPISGVEWNADYRDIFHDYYSADLNRDISGYDYRRYYLDQIRTYNKRITLILGYQFSKHSFLMAGVSYDVDGDYEGGLGNMRVQPRRFDGGFGRFTITW